MTHAERTLQGADVVAAALGQFGAKPTLSFSIALYPSSRASPGTCHSAGSTASSASSPEPIDSSERRSAVIDNWPAIRAASMAEAARLGYATNPTLPLLDVADTPRAVADIISRMLCLDAVLAAAYGYPKSRALEWLMSESLVAALTTRERAFLANAADDADIFQIQADAMFALAWVGSLVDNFTFDRECPNTLVSSFPDLRKMETTIGFAHKVVLRPVSQIAAQNDLAYCLNWAIIDAAIRGGPVPGTLHPGSIVERRRAIQWVMSNDPWDDVSLDT